MEENLVLPVVIKLLDQVLDFESNARLHLLVGPLLEHRLQAGL